MLFLKRCCTAWCHTYIQCSIPPIRSNARRLKGRLQQRSASKVQDVWIRPLGKHVQPQSLLFSASAQMWNITQSFMLIRQTAFMLCAHATPKSARNRKMPGARTAHSGVSNAQARIDCAQEALRRVTRVHWCCWSVGGSVGMCDMYTARMNYWISTPLRAWLTLNWWRGELRNYSWVMLLITSHKRIRDASQEVDAQPFINIAFHWPGQWKLVHRNIRK